MTLRAGDLLTVKQARDLVPVGRTTFYELLAEGQIPSHRIRTKGSSRGRILIDRRDLEAFVEESRRTASVASTRGGMDAELTETRRGP